MFPDNWSDFDKALFMLDAAEQVLTDSLMQPSQVANEFLDRYSTHLELLRSEYVKWHQ